MRAGPVMAVEGNDKASAIPTRFVKDLRLRESAGAQQLNKQKRLIRIVPLHVEKRALRAAKETEIRRIGYMVADEPEAHAPVVAEASRKLGDALSVRRRKACGQDLLRGRARQSNRAISTTTADRRRDRARHAEQRRRTVLRRDRDPPAQRMSGKTRDNTGY